MTGHAQGHAPPRTCHAPPRTPHTTELFLPRTATHMPRTATHFWGSGVARDPRPAAHPPHPRTRPRAPRTIPRTPGGAGIRSGVLYKDRGSSRVTVTQPPPPPSTHISTHPHPAAATASICRQCRHGLTLFEIFSNVHRDCLGLRGLSSMRPQCALRVCIWGSGGVRSAAPRCPPSPSAHKATRSTHKATHTRRGAATLGGTI